MSGRDPPPGARSIRYRLLVIALLPTLVILPALLGVTMLRWSGKFDDLLITKVNSDLTVARQYLTRILDTTGERMAALGQSADFANGADPKALLERRRSAMELDFLQLVGADGHLLAASPNSQPGSTAPLLQTALVDQATTGIAILSNAELALIDPALAARAKVALVPTPNAAPTSRSTEDRGMVILSALPVQLPGGNRGALIGGLLLNQNLGFIDTINDLVYRAGSLPEGSVGTATLFLDDVRISTNVRLFEGVRALGTRVSEAVRDRVLLHGETWLDRAFVVNDWYISAYEPIRDTSGQAVGMLYVGFLETPFAETKRETIWLVLLGFLVVTIVSIPIFFRWARGVFRPLERVVDTMAQVEAGQMSARTGVISRGDEVGRVAGHLDELLDQLQERDEELRRWNNELNARVEETSRKLLLSEKLATIGEITASAAHEINNPVAVLQGNLDLLRELMLDKQLNAETEFRLMDEQIQRISNIVNRLLQFARPEDYAGWATRTDPRDAVASCLPLVRHLLSQARVGLRTDGRSSRQVLMNRTELQQVMINLIVNAIHAMPDGGEIVITLSDTDRDAEPGVEIRVNDTGAGIPAEELPKLFEAFYTTRPEAGGTGLGLAVVRNLLDRHGGTVSVSSVPGQGSSFTLWLPEAR